MADELDLKRTNQKVCFIGGAGHSGSTLLGFVLGSHRDCFYAGEAAKTRYLHNSRKKLKKRVCKLCGPNCPIWGNFFRTEQPDLYEQISRATGARTVIDSSKNLDWIAAHIQELKGLPATPYFIFLQRDGRAVINSRVRKYPEKPLTEQIKKWVEKIRATAAFFERLDVPKLIVRYEEFATRPEGTTRQICDFLGISYQTGMLEFYRHQHHPLGGNNGTQYLVARHHGPNPERPYTELASRSRDYYQNHAPEIRLDLRWKTELDGEVLDLFEQMAGPDNDAMRWEHDRP